jgi:hypothetical protein
MPACRLLRLACAFAVLRCADAWPRRALLSSAQAAVYDALNSVLRAADANWPIGWTVRGPTWCCGSCCGSIACFPCYTAPREFVHARADILTAVAAGAQPLPQPALKPIMLANVDGGPLMLPPELGEQLSNAAQQLAALASGQADDDGRGV